MFIILRGPCQGVFFVKVFLLVFLPFFFFFNERMMVVMVMMMMMMIDFSGVVCFFVNAIFGKIF